MRFKQHAGASLAALFFAVLTCGPAAGETVPQAATPALAPWAALTRLTLVSSDIERSKQFYADVFGYTVRFDGDITTASTQALLNLAPRDKARFVVLGGPSELAGKAIKATSIGLIQITRARPLPVLAQPRGNRLASGQAMMAVVTEDLARVIAQLQRLKAPIVAGPLVSHDGHETEIVTQDPDGTRIHVVEQR